MASTASFISQTPYRHHSLPKKTTTHFAPALNLCLRPVSSPKTSQRLRISSALIEPDGGKLCLKVYASHTPKVTAFASKSPTFSPELNTQMTGAQPKTVVVGVKLDSHSKELLTWALVKVADSGDHVIAVHVLDSVSEETSCLLLLVKTFDSVLSGYEGLCSLKQVDLKVKVCRGHPIRKILAREAQAFHADVVIVGTSKTHHRLRSSVAVAK